MREGGELRVMVYSSVEGIAEIAVAQRPGTLSGVGNNSIFTPY